MDKGRLQKLLEEYFNDTIDSHDCDELLKYIDQTDPALFSGMIDTLVRDREDGPVFEDEQRKRIYERIQSDPRLFVKQLKFYQKGWFRIAAILIVFFSFVFYFINTKKPDPDSDKKLAIKGTKEMIVPGTKRAILTLSNGKKIALDHTGAGQLAEESGVEIKKTEKGEIIYNTSAQHAKSAAVAYNKIETPRGGEYQVVLPDGTRVWLNSASALSYPTVFSGNTRDVSLTGEAYFEVVKNGNEPFQVHVNGTTVQVLGTHFNITSYADEPHVTTTLLEGAVKVVKNDHQALLKPGQKAVIGNASDQINISPADISEIIAWKNGYFLFRDEDIKSIMRKISRWYDIDVEYRGNVSEHKFGGTFYRSKSFGELLHYLEKLGPLHFKIEGRRIIVIT